VVRSPWAPARRTGDEHDIRTSAQPRTPLKPLKPLGRLTSPLPGLLVAALVADVIAVFTDIYQYVQHTGVPGTSRVEDWYL
jgi:hypothetical protein